MLHDSSGSSSPVETARERPNSSGIEISHARVQDWEAISRFIDAAYGAEAPFKGLKRWRWQFVENPWRSTVSDHVPVWIALEGANVVGQTAVQEGVLHLRGEPHAAGWIVDVMVLSSHRGLGLGHRVNDPIAKAIPIVVTLTMAAATRRIAEKAGCITLGPVEQLGRPVRPSPSDVRRYLIHRTGHHPRLIGVTKALCALGGHAVIAALLRPLLGVGDLVRAASRPAGITITQLPDPIPKIDELWRRCSGQYPAIFERSGTFVAWRFQRVPDLKYSIFIAERNGTPVGYSVLRRRAEPELRHGVITDVFTDREVPEALDALLDHALAYFGKSVAGIEAGASFPDAKQVYHRRGFVKIRTHYPTVVCSDAKTRETIESLRDQFYFTKADHDWDQVYPG